MRCATHLLGLQIHTGREKWRAAFPKTDIHWDSGWWGIYRLSMGYGSSTLQSSVLFHCLPLFAKKKKKKRGGVRRNGQRLEAFPKSGKLWWLCCTTPDFIL
jgi:hypothetical protein